MRKGFAALVMVTVLLFSTTALAADVQQLLVLDQSGSMEPFYNHPQDRLRQFLKTLTATDSVFGKNDPVTVMLFSEAGAAKPSPQVIYTGTVEGLRKDWAAVTPKMTAIAQWTDLLHGLNSAVQGMKGPGIIWFLTDNVSEQAQGRERQDTLGFYEALKAAPEFQSLTDIQVFPLDLQHPTQKQGLMLYAMLWAPPGTPAAVTDQYHAITKALTESRLPEFMGVLPLLVKPLDKEPFRLEVTEFTPDGGKPVPVKLKDGKVVLPAGKFAEGQPIKGTLTGRLVSNYETFKIPRASIKASLTDPRTIDFNPVKPGLQKVDPENLGDIGAKSTSQTFSVRLELPPLTASWNAQSLLGTSGTVETDLKLEATLAGGLEVDTSRISHLTFHAMTELPKLFAKDVKTLPVQATIEIPVKYSGARFWVAVAILLALAAIAIGLVIAVVRFVGARWEWTLTAPDGSEMTLLFRRWHRKELIFWESAIIGTLKWRSPTALTFLPEGDAEPTELDDGGSFTAAVDGQFLLFRVEPRYSAETGGDDDVA